ncbi:harpin-induced like protein 4 [Zostera marina]|uniref:Harpin-induced like protein 4 n=1 Tax=Zostera marina TaxID=29655 RepID=A0A0K9NMJ2_ZOSMR|nr:harpin-induced like protein 4 [Zostera marina]
MGWDQCSKCSHGSECGDGWEWKAILKKKYVLIGSGIATFLILITIIILTVYLALRPSKPSFTLHDASVMNLNLSTAPSLVDSTLQISLFFRNSNKRIGVHYDQLKVYATYKDQQITMSTAFPPLYQGFKEVSAYSPFLCGSGVPIAPSLEVQLDHEKESGVLHLDIRVDGKVRWKVGRWRSQHYHIRVNCPAVFDYYRNNNDDDDASILSPKFRIHHMTECQVDV